MTYILWFLCQNFCLRRAKGATRPEAVWRERGGGGSRLPQPLGGALENQTGVCVEATNKFSPDPLTLWLY